MTAAVRTEPAASMLGAGGWRALVREVLALAAPAVLTTFLQTLVFLTDRVLLGRYSQDALASMQVQGPLLWSLFSVFTGLVVGTVPLVARAIGARDEQRARAVTRAALMLSFGLGLLVVALFWPLTAAIVRLIGPESAGVRALSERYISIALFGFPPMFLATAASMVLYSAGNTKTPLFVGVISNGVNVVASVVLVFGVSLGPLGRVPELGVAGAAIGSVAAFTLEALLLCLALARGRAGFALGALAVWSAAERQAARALVRVSSPALAERLVVHAGFLTYVTIISALGPLVMASNQALITLESVCFLGADGFAIAAASLVGRNLGAGTPHAARLAGAFATGFAMLALTLLGLSIWATGAFTLELFVPSGADGGALVSEGMRALPLLALSQPFMAASIVLSHALRGAGDTRTPLFAAIMGGLLVRLSLAAWLGFGLELGLVSVWIASGVDWVCRTLLLGWVFARGRWARIVL